MCTGSNKPTREQVAHALSESQKQKQLLDMMDQANDTVPQAGHGSSIGLEVEKCRHCGGDYNSHRKRDHPFERRYAMQPVDRQHFETGAVRDNDKEARYDLVPPVPLRKLSVHFGRGAKKYAERNWEKGIPFMRMYASTMRHMQAWVSGEDIDQDETMKNPEHLVAALWNIYCLIELSQTHQELDDRPSKPKKSVAVPDTGPVEWEE
jgi:hypothetical protein